jgi:succinoglycan biosynthesis protein ExoO
MQPDVSFVIAAFNAEQTLARAIESALDQRELRSEVIVADDCSSDRTLEVARLFPPERVRIVALPENRGPGAARNAGFAAARAPWIAVVDADDTVYPERMARLVTRAERAGAKAAVDNLDVISETTGAISTMFEPRLLGRFSELTLADFIAANLLFEKTFSFGYMKPIFDRRFVERNALRYDETLRIGEDYIFLAEALAKGARCVVEPQAGYAYHIRSGSISRVLELAHVEAMLDADERFLGAHELDEPALAAQQRRTRSLRRAKAFLTLVQHIKDRAPLKAIATALSDPSAVTHLRMPVAARLRRLVRPVGKSATSTTQQQKLGGGRQTIRIVT